MTPLTLYVINFDRNEKMGTITLTDDGTLTTTGIAEGMVRRLQQAGWSTERIWRRYNGWSNGYSKIDPID